jgi:hypothetical protein
VTSCCTAHPEHRCCSRPRQQHSACLRDSGSRWRGRSRCALDGIVWRQRSARANVRSLEMHAARAVQGVRHALAPSTDPGMAGARRMRGPRCQQPRHVRAGWTVRARTPLLQGLLHPRRAASSRGRRQAGRRELVAYGDGWLGRRGVPGWRDGGGVGCCVGQPAIRWRFRTAPRAKRADTGSESALRGPAGCDAERVGRQQRGGHA